MIKIEKNIALPQSVTQIIRDLKRGDSVLIPGSAARTRTIVSRVRQEFPAQEYTTKAEKSGVRVWRTK